MHFLHLFFKMIFIILISLFFSSYSYGTADDGSNNIHNNTNNGIVGTLEKENKLYGITPEAQPLTYDQYVLTVLTDDDFNALSLENKYKVAQKLYSTLFYGTKLDDLNGSIASGTFISQTREMFDQPNNPLDLTAVEEQILNYKSLGTGETIVPILARLFHLPAGKAYLHRWAAYVLTQTIFFSPALELDTVKATDVTNVYNTLIRDFDDGLSLQWITFQHMITDSNWRRFRSPEDNGREMLEIFLMDHNDSHVPLAGKALKNWQLDRETNTLIITLNENTEPITNLFDGKTIFDGTDFYSAIVLEPDFLLTVCRRLVNIYFPNYTDIQKDSVVSQLVFSQPTTWTGLLKQIIYSKEYLLHSKKIRTFEESFFPIAKTLDWHPHQYSFHTVYDALDKTNQSIMRYKLGREDEVPLDTESFAWFHKSLRENLMIKYEKNPSFISLADGWSLKGIFSDIPDGLNTNDKIAEYIVHALFIPIAGREAYTQEVQFFKDLIDANKFNVQTFRNYGRLNLIDNNDPENDLAARGYLADMILDYISRLSQTYQFETVE